MLALVYAYTGDASRSVLRASLIAEVEIDEIPEDQDDFAAEHGGDFIEVLDTLVAR